MPCPRPLRARLHMPQIQKRPRRRESPPPPKPVWHRREQSKSATFDFWRGRASAGIAHRQGKRNM
eukprot:8520065-Ditylum_brightwellii.AAC.1